jgi:exo-beta-1,3-glucanase (GH17 family)
MKNPSFFGSLSMRALLGVLLSCTLASCGGGDSKTTPVTGVQLRPLSPEFTTRKAVNYSPYRTAVDVNGLAAEDIPKPHIKEDLDLIMAAGFRLIRVFDSDDKVAKQTLEVIRDNQLNLKMQLGVFIQSGNDNFNQTQVARAVALANGFPDIVLAVSVGNENMASFTANRLSPLEMAAYITKVRGQITQPVTTDDNYIVWVNAPTVLTDVVDFASVHTYAVLDTVFDPKLWDWRQRASAPATRAVDMMNAAITETRRQYALARAALDAKGLTAMPITVGETGWKAVNPGNLALRAHPVNQKMYLDRLSIWADEGKTGAGPKAVFYFEAFDEPWKGDDDKWGLFNVQRQARYAVQALNTNNTPAGSATWVWEPGSYVDTDAVAFAEAVVKDPVTESRYTVYSDTAQGASDRRPTDLRRDGFEGKNGTTALSPEVSTTFGPGDASHAIEITPKPPFTFGWGVLIQGNNGSTDNLSGYVANGTLNFSVSTLYPGKIEIGIASDTVDRVGQEAFLQLQPGNFGYCNTGAWCQVSIPLQAFLAVNPALDLSLVTSRFVIADRYGITGNAPGNTTKIDVDGIFWAK